MIYIFKIHFKFIYKFHLKIRARTLKDGIVAVGASSPTQKIGEKKI